MTWQFLTFCCYHSLTKCHPFIIPPWNGGGPNTRASCTARLGTLVRFPTKGRDKPAQTQHPTWDPVPECRETCNGAHWARFPFVTVSPCQNRKQALCIINHLDMGSSPRRSINSRAHVIRHDDVTMTWHYSPHFCPWCSSPWEESKYNGSGQQDRNTGKETTSSPHNPCSTVQQYLLFNKPAIITCECQGCYF